jgi:hypothetical protein
MHIEMFVSTLQRCFSITVKALYNCSLGMSSDSGINENEKLCEQLLISFGEKEKEKPLESKAVFLPPQL